MSEVKKSVAKYTILCHDDEVSGVTILLDGTRAYWTEGRSSAVLFVKPDGETVEMGNDISTVNEPLMVALRAADEAVCDYRAMTAAEIADYDMVRGR